MTLKELEAYTAVTAMWQLPLHIVFTTNRSNCDYNHPGYSTAGY